MVNLLVGNSSVVLQDIVAFALRGVVLVELQDVGQFLDHWEQVGQVLVRNVVQLGTMVLRNDKTVGLGSRLDVQERVGVLGLQQLERGNLALDDFAKDAQCVGSHDVCEDGGS